MKNVLTALAVLFRIFFPFFRALSSSVQVFVGWQLLYFYLPFVFVAIVVDDF